MIGLKKRGRPFVLREIDKLAFDAWANTGSLDNARQYFQDHKILHSSGRQYSVMGIRYCAMRYMINCYDEARAFITEEYKRNGLVYNEQAIDIALLGYAVEILRTREETMKWAEKHGLINDYNIAYIEERTNKIHAYLDARRKRTVQAV